MNIGRGCLAVIYIRRGCSLQSLSEHYYVARRVEHMRYGEEHAGSKNSSKPSWVIVLVRDAYNTGIATRYVRSYPAIVWREVVIYIHTQCAF